MRNNIESYGLRKRTALATSNDIALLYGERWGAMDGDVLVPLFVTAVLRDVVQVIPSDNDGTLHFGGDDHASQNSSADRNVTGEGTLLVNVATFNSGIRCLNTKTNILYKTHRFLTNVTDGTLTSDKDTILLLVSFFVLCCPNRIKSQIVAV